MTQLSRKEVQAILDRAPKGVDKSKILDGIISRGYDIEGVDSNQVRQKIQIEQQPAKEEPIVQEESGVNPLSAGLQKFSKGYEQISEGVSEGKPGLVGRGILNEVAGGLETVFSPVTFAIEKVANVPGVKQVLEVAGIGIDAVADKISESEALQKFVMENPNAEETIGNLLTVGTTIGGGKLAPQARSIIRNNIATLESKIPSIKMPKTNIIEGLGNIEKGITSGTSESIMNRVARLKPTDANKFKKLSGKTQGEYLAETGNFGSPDKIIAKEAEKFVASKGSVDTELAKLPGSFKAGVIEDVLDSLVKKAKGESTKNVKSPYLDRALELQKKYKKEGLTMAESNEVKRLFERNVKLGYNKLINPEKVTQATNIDNALRKWQVSKAKELGFENIAELNKQTQISKFIIDKLGDQVVGKNGLNGIGLSDWVILGGGDPTAVGAFLTKKFFSSDSVQAKIAEILNTAEPKAPIKPRIKKPKAPIKPRIKKPKAKNTKQQ